MRPRNHWLHIAFSVKQKCLRTVDEAVSAMLEIESYLDLNTICKVDTMDTEIAETKPIGANEVASLPDMMKQVMDRLDKLKAWIDQPTSQALTSTILTLHVGTAESKAILPIYAILQLGVRKMGNH